MPLTEQEEADAALDEKYMAEKLEEKGHFDENAWHWDKMLAEGT